MKSVILEAEGEQSSDSFTTAFYEIPVTAYVNGATRERGVRHVRLVQVRGNTTVVVVLYDETQWRRVRDILSELLGETK